MSTIECPNLIAVARTALIVAINRRPDVRLRIRNVSLKSGTKYGIWSQKTRSDALGYAAQSGY